MAKEVRTEGVLLKGVRKVCLRHKACPSNLLCPKFLLVNENVAISSSCPGPPFLLGKFIHVVAHHEGAIEKR